MKSLVTRTELKAGATRIEQMYITHCLHGEGVHRQAGFNIRACSRQDALLQRFALEYPHYVLPAGMAAAEMSPHAAPCRLALVRIPGGKKALIHSVFLPDAGRGRANNFFTHELILPVLEPRKALATWGSPDWVTSCNPQDAPNLPPLEELPRPGPVNDAAVTAFLQRSAPAMNGKPAPLFCPERLSGKGERRRELLRQVLRGCQLTLEAPPIAARCRFYILAEPELAALLLYAAARLLPEALAAMLTFSTYEPARRDLRLYKHARVVGTCLADPAAGLAQEFYTTRGYALDTFRHEFSRELAGPAEKEIEEWIDLAAQGEWQTIDQIHGLFGTKSAVLVSLTDARQAFTLSRMLAAAKAGAEDLLAARRSAWGPAILDRFRDKVWLIVRDASLADDRLREAFADVLELHVPELEERFADALRSQSPADWQQHWRLLKFAVHDDAARLWEAFHRALPEPPYAPELRVALLQELHRLQLTRHPRKLQFHKLLKRCSNPDLEQLARSSLDRRWLIRALCYALLELETKQEALRQLHGGDEELVRLFWEQFRLITKEPRRREVLTPLFPVSEAGRQFLSRSLKAGCPLPAQTWEWLLDRLGAWQTEWRGFWMSNNHLGRLLNLLNDSGEEAAPLWQRLAGQINQDVLVPGEPYQKALLLELVAAKDRRGGAVPPAAAGLVAGWSVLRAHFEKACGIPETDRRKIIDACHHCRLDPIEMLAKYFQQFVIAQGFDKEVLDDFLAFFHSFCPSGEEYQHCGCRLLWWLRIVERVPEECGRAAYQRYYLDRFLPFEYRWRLAEEALQSGKLLACVYESCAKPTEPGHAGFAAGPTPCGQDEFFELTGLHLLPQHSATPLVIVGKRLLSMFSIIVGAAALMILCHQYQDELRRAPAVALFMPAIYALAAGLAFQSAGLALRCRRDPRLHRPSLLRRLGGGLLIELILGSASGFIAGGLTVLWGEPFRLALCVGITAASGIVIAEVLGRALPVFLRSMHWESRIAAGLLAPPACGILLLLLYFTLARWLVG